MYRRESNAWRLGVSCSDLMDMIFAGFRKGIELKEYREKAGTSIQVMSKDEKAVE